MFLPQLTLEFIVFVTYPDKTMNSGVNCLPTLEFIGDLFLQSIDHKWQCLSQ